MEVDVTVSPTTTRDHGVPVALGPSKMRTLSQQVSALAYVSVKVIRCPRGATKVEGAQAHELPYSDTPAPTCDFQVPGVVSTPLGPPQAPPFTTAVDKDAEVREGVGIGREGVEEGEREREGERASE